MSGDFDPMKRLLYLGVSGHRKWLAAISLLALVMAAGSATTDAVGSRPPRNRSSRPPG